jgi:hypothetical protein
MDGQKQNNIPELPPLTTYRLENLFKVYKDSTEKYFYNILNTVNIPTDINSAYYTTYTVPANNTPWTYISYILYGTPELWWLVCATNDIKNPINFPVAGTQLKVLVPAVVSNILSTIKSTQ